MGWVGIKYMNDRMEESRKNFIISKLELVKTNTGHNSQKLYLPLNNKNRSKKISSHSLSYHQSNENKSLIQLCCSLPLP